MKKILISVNPWETRAAILTGTQLQNIYVSTASIKQLERSFYKGLVTKVLPGIQTAFVDIGQEKAGFLHISEIDRELALARMQDVALDDEVDEERLDATAPISRQALDISKILQEGEAILVQVSKEPVYEKGAKLTTCFTLPGRFIVLLPNIPRIGISKKIDNREERQRLKQTILSNLPEGMGAIIRTSSLNREEKELKQDIIFLVKTWKAILDKFAKANIREKIHEDLPLSLAVVRDYLDEDVEAVITNDKKTHQELYKFVKNIAPEYVFKIKLFTEPPLFFPHFGIDKQIDDALEKKAQLKSGGSIIIETTEAMTVIDVNTGKYTGKSNLEETILQTNLEAAEEIVRQLKLRNIGGLIVIDFIDMSMTSNRQKLYRFLEQTLREHDKYQSVVLKVSEFGLVQMTRKRTGKTLIQQLTQACNVCHGRGVVKSVFLLGNAILQDLKLALLETKKPCQVTLSVSPELFEHLTNAEYDTILLLEHQFGCTITLEAHPHVTRESHHLHIKPT
jgi:ribonuclease G